MNQREAYAAGYDCGAAAIKYTEVGESDKCEAGCGCAEDKCCRQCLTMAAYKAEDNARQFSPWECIARSINECGDRSEGLWEAYDRGVAAAFRKGVTRRMRALREL